MENEASTPKVLVLHSGGIDSTTCLYMAIGLVGRDNTYSFSIDYGQRHRKELEYAKAICTETNVVHEVVKIDSIPNTMLTDSTIEIPKVSYEELEGVSPTYVPFRNGLFLSTLASIAQGRFENSTIYFGAHAEDAKNWAYPDCTPEFISAMGKAINIGSYGKVKLEAPLQFMTKADIIMKGNSLGVPLGNTWSCYHGGDIHCGECPTCISRRKAFYKAEIIDSTSYKQYIDL